ncbi:MAG: phytoene desaturase family protein [Acidimicrobiia bacterium]
MDHDAIVVGGGHNGLTCAAYLARAGLEVVVLEARPSVGGCASTVDALGARFNVCNCDHVLVRATPVIEELNLARHGLSYLDLEPHLLAMGWDGEAPWFGFHSLERTLESLAQSYPHEVEAYRRYCREAIPVAELLVALTQIIPTPARILKNVLAKGGRGTATLLRWNRMSAESVLRTFFTDTGLIAPALALAPAVWGVSPTTPGTGLGALTFALRHLVPPGRPAGGSGALPVALAGALAEFGGRVRCSATVDRVVIERDRVRGVVLADRELVEAPVVISATDPRRTLVDWLQNPPRVVGALSERWRKRTRLQGYESKVDGVAAHLPSYRLLDSRTLNKHGVTEPLIPTAIIAPPPDEIAAAHSLLAGGEVADRPMLFVNFPSVLDAKLSPGRLSHVFSMEVLFTPFALTGGWPGSTEPARWLTRYGELIEPGFLQGIRQWRVMTPCDYETQFGLTNGYAPSFTGGPLAALLGKDPELTRYTTPIKGLYLTGAGTYPGAGVWGASGRNTAEVVLRDFDRGVRR